MVLHDQMLLPRYYDNNNKKELLDEKVDQLLKSKMTTEMKIKLKIICIQRLSDKFF